MSEVQLKFTVEFGGGAELLFNKIKKHNLEFTSNKQWTIGSLIVWLKDNLLTERAELFIQEGSVRPGILVLVNDTDWELLGELNYTIQPEDNIMFISTLHGG